MHSLRILALVSLLTACGGNPVPTIETTQFNPALKVDLSHSTKIAGGEYIRDLAAGSGPTVAAGQLLAVHYSGAFPDGRVFDQNGATNPAFRFTFGVGEVIAGWDEGLAGATVGSTRQLIIPPALGYGSSDYGGIPGNSILVFTVNIVSVQGATIETTQFDPSLGVDLTQSTKLANGEYVRDTTVGSGPVIAAGQLVSVHYSGAFNDGAVFDQNGSSQAPFTFHLGKGEVIAGWDQGLAGATVGTTRQLVIPPALGYGPAGHGPIPGGAILVFSVQIVSAQ